jgi:hypothetical protein
VFTQYIPKLNDRDVIRSFQTVKDEFPEKGLVITFSDRLGQVASDDLEQLSKLAGHFLEGASIRLNNVTWTWQRLQAGSNDQHSPRYDKLSLDWNQQQGVPNRSQISPVSAALDRSLRRPLVAVRDEGDAADFTSQREVLAALEGAVTQLLVDSVQHRTQLENSYNEKGQALEQRNVELRKRELERLDEERVRVENELKERKAALDQRSEELDSLQKKSDDRNNTHVRREIRSSLLQLAKDRLENFALSRQTRLQYSKVNVAAIFGVLILASLSAWFGYEGAIGVGGNVYSVPIYAIKSGLLALAAVALGTWYLKWLNRWLHRMADAEFKLQQFRLDIERASWLAETVLEWKSKVDEPFPDLLASRLSTGLFHTSPTEADDPKTPASYLADALFGAASSAKIKIGDQEIVLDRRSIKKLEREQ